MKKLIVKIIAYMSVLLISLNLAGCTNAGNISNSKSGLTIICTIFPVYDWVRNITRDCDDVSVKLLIDNGADMHSYQPTVENVVSIIDSDVVIYIGGESDKWLLEVLEANPRENRVELSIMDLASNYMVEEEIVEGMQAEEEKSEEDEIEYDEHVWMSIEKAAQVTGIICDELSELIPDKAKLLDNTESYIMSLHNEGAKYKEVLENCPNNRIIVADRFPFRYLCDDYGIDYFAAFPGCSTDANADFDTIIFLSQCVDDYGINAVCSTENTAADISDTVIEASGKKLNKVTLNSMQSVTAGDIEGGVTYLSICEDNLSALKLALE